MFSAQQKTNVVLSIVQSTKHTLRLHPCIVLLSWVLWELVASASPERLQLLKFQERHFIQSKKSPLPVSRAKQELFSGTNRVLLIICRKWLLLFFMCLLALKSEKDNKNNILVPKGQRVSGYLADLDPTHTFFFVFKLYQSKYHFR